MKSYKHSNARLNYERCLREEEHTGFNKKFRDCVDSKGPYFECYFWNTEKELPNNDRNILYRPIVIATLAHVPSVGMYLCYSNEVYVVTGVCMNIRDAGIVSSEFVKYDIEVERVDNSTEL